MAVNSIKVCESCGEENPGWACYCRGCSAKLGAVTLVARPMKWSVPRGAILSILLCAAALGLLVSLSQNARNTTGPKALQVVWHKFYGAYAKEWVVGDVRNQSSHTLQNVMVVAEYYSDDNREIEVARSPLEPSALPPGAVGHFKVGAPYDDSIVKSWFHFQTTDGTQISFARDTPPNPATAAASAGARTSPSATGETSALRITAH